MRRPPSLCHGRLWRALLVVLVLAGLGIWHGGHCPDHVSARSATAVADAAAAPAVPAAGHRDSHAGAALGGPDSAAGDCHLAISTESAIAAGVTSLPAPAQQHVGIVGTVAPRPVPRLRTGRSLSEIGVSRT